MEHNRDHHRSIYIWAVLLALAAVALPFLLIGLAMLEEFLFGTESLIAIYRALGIDPLLRALLRWLSARLGYV